MSKDNAAVRDQLGLDPEITPFIIPDFDETAKIIEGPTIIRTYSIGNSWIVGSSTNGIVGTNTSTANGLQQVVGSANRVSTISSIVNRENMFTENFSTIYFRDNASTTGTWSTLGTARITPAQVLQSSTVYNDTGTVTSATMTMYFDEGSAGLVTAYMSANGTATAFETVTDNTLKSFTNTGRDLRWKVLAVGTATLRKVTIQYNM